MEYQNLHSKELRVTLRDLWTSCFCSCKVHFICSSSFAVFTAADIAAAAAAPPPPTTTTTTTTTTTSSFKEFLDI